MYIVRIYSIHVLRYYRKFRKAHMKIVYTVVVSTQWVLELKFLQHYVVHALLQLMYSIHVLLHCIQYYKHVFIPVE